MFCCVLLCVHSSIAIILEGKRELFDLLNLSSWCLVMVEWLFLAVPWNCLRFVIVVFPDHTHLLLLKHKQSIKILQPVICTVKKISNKTNIVIPLKDPEIQTLAVRGDTMRHKLRRNEPYLAKLCPIDVMLVSLRDYLWIFFSVFDIDDLDYL